MAIAAALSVPLFIFDHALSRQSRPQSRDYLNLPKDDAIHLGCIRSASRIGRFDWLTRDTSRKNALVRLWTSGV